MIVGWITAVQRDVVAGHGGKGRQEVLTTSRRQEARREYDELAAKARDGSRHSLKAAGRAGNLLLVLVGGEPVSMGIIPHPFPICSCSGQRPNNPAEGD